MAKKVEHNGKSYKIDFRDFGYSDSRFIVNGEESSNYMANSMLTDVNAFSKMAKKAIEEYEARKAAKEAFDTWDGKI